MDGEQKSRPFSLSQNVIKFDQFYILNESVYQKHDNGFQLHNMVRTLIDICINKLSTPDKCSEGEESNLCWHLCGFGNKKKKPHYAGTLKLAGVGPN